MNKQGPGKVDAAYYEGRQDDQGNILSLHIKDAPCDRCGKQAETLYAFKLSETITYRGRLIRYPWLCHKCMVVEKTKWWKEEPK